MKFKSKKIWVFRVCVFIVALGMIAVAIMFGINTYVKSCAKDRILSLEKAVELKDVDCVLVLGCGVTNDGMPTDMLYDRLIRGIELYNLGISPKLLMSGDHSRVSYDEVNVMKQFAIDRGVPSEDIFMDHAGFSTYESLYRARDIFLAKKIIIVTQGYHLYRALFIADKLGLKAYGVAADLRTYNGQAYRNMREILARDKDYILTMFKPEPTYLGASIPVNGNGDVTNDH